MRNFKKEDFSGAGQYLVRTTDAHISDTSYLATIIKKVGWITNDFGIGTGEQLITLTYLSDGMTTFCHYPNYKKAQQYQKEGRELDFDKWEKVIWQNDSYEVRNGWDKFVDYLNNHAQEHRFATHEELIRVALYQEHRCKKS